MKNKEKEKQEYKEIQITIINISGFTFFIKNYNLLENKV